MEHSKKNETHVQFKLHCCASQVKVGTFTEDARFTYNQVGVRIHSDEQNECWTTKESMEGQISMKPEPAWMAENLWLVVMVRW